MKKIKNKNINEVTEKIATGLKKATNALGGRVTRTFYDYKIDWSSDIIYLDNMEIDYSTKMMVWSDKDERKKQISVAKYLMFWINVYEKSIEFLETLTPELLTGKSNTEINSIIEKVDNSIAIIKGKFGVFKVENLRQSEISKQIRDLLIALGTGKKFLKSIENTENVPKNIVLHAFNIALNKLKKNKEEKFFENKLKEFNEEKYGTENKFVGKILLSRHPIDVVRMSDHIGMASCHSPGGSEWGSCLVEAVSDSGLVVYLIEQKQYDNFMKNFKGDIQKDEIFKDVDRGVFGMTPISRMRMRAIEDTETEEVFFIPYKATYGQRGLPWESEVFKIARDIQADKLNNIVEKTEDNRSIINLSGFSLMGGEYDETDWRQSFELLYPEIPDLEVMGNVLNFNNDDLGEYEDLLTTYDVNDVLAQMGAYVEEEEILTREYWYTFLGTSVTGVSSSIVHQAYVLKLELSIDVDIDLERVFVEEYDLSDFEEDVDAEELYYENIYPFFKNYDLDNMGSITGRSANIYDIKRSKRGDDFTVSIETDISATDRNLEMGNVAELAREALVPLEKRIHEMMRGVKDAFFRTIKQHSLLWKEDEVESKGAVEQKLSELSDSFKENLVKCNRVVNLCGLQELNPGNVAKVISRGYKTVPMYDQTMGIILSKLCVNSSATRAYFTFNTFKKMHNDGKMNYFINHLMENYQGEIEREFDYYAKKYYEHSHDFLEREKNLIKKIIMQNGVSQKFTAPQEDKMFFDIYDTALKDSNVYSIIITIDVPRVNNGVYNKWYKILTAIDEELINIANYYDPTIDEKFKELFMKIGKEALETFAIEKKQGNKYLVWNSYEEIINFVYNHEKVEKIISGNFNGL